MVSLLTAGKGAFAVSRSTGASLLSCTDAARPHPSNKITPKTVRNITAPHRCHRHRCRGPSSSSRKCQRLFEVCGGEKTSQGQEVRVERENQPGRDRAYTRSADGKGVDSSGCGWVENVRTVLCAAGSRFSDQDTPGSPDKMVLIRRGGCPRIVQTAPAYCYTGS